MKNAVVIEFFIARDGLLTADGQVVGRFGNAAGAADFAIRLAQDAEALYRIFYH